MAAKYKVNAKGRESALGYGSLPFDAQITFFKKKLAMPTRTWTDLWQSNHDHAFVVAGATKMALVEDLQADVQKAIEKGTTLHQFRKDFDATVAKHGWTGWKGEGTKAGHAWRTKIIYQTNMRTSYAAGRFEQLQSFEYWQYHHSPVSNDPRPEHLKYNGLIRPKDDPIWDVIFPPNGWGCNCYVTGLSKQRMKAKGLKVSDPIELEWEERLVGSHGPSPRTVKVPKGIDPGFAYAPGRSAWMRAHVPAPKGSAPNGFAQLIPARSARDLMPEPLPFAKDKLLPAMPVGDEEKYVARFLDQFGGDIGKPVLFTDAAGDAVVISEALFKDFKGRWKVAKREREQYLLMLAEAIKHPDEIWVGMEWHHATGKAIVRRRYISRHQIEGSNLPAFTVFEHGRDGWQGKTTYAPDHPVKEFDQELENIRKGVRLYKRSDK